jgi:hypothetical protein
MKYERDIHNIPNSECVQRHLLSRPEVTVLVQAWQVTRPKALGRTFKHTHPVKVISQLHLNYMHTQRQRDLQQEGCDI